MYQKLSSDNELLKIVKIVSNHNKLNRRWNILEISRHSFTYR